MDVADGTRVELPPGAAGPIEVFVNGVPQRAGADFRREPGAIVFRRPLAREGRLGFWRWASMLLGAAGTYRAHDTVDVVYELNGRRTVASGLEPVPE